MDGDSSVAFAPFYIEVAEIAKLKGVTVSIVSLEGEDCSMDNLSIVTEQTSGEVERVDPRYSFFLAIAPSYTLLGASPKISSRFSQIPLLRLDAWLPFSCTKG